MDGGCQRTGKTFLSWFLKTLKKWNQFVNLFKFIPQNPNDISYVYSGYAPLSIRLTQVLARPGWRSIEEVLKMLPGPHFEERQQLPAGLHKKRKGTNRVGCLPCCSLNKIKRMTSCLLCPDKTWALFLWQNSSRLMAQSWQPLSMLGVFCVSVENKDR